KDVPFVCVVDSIAIRANEGIVSAASDFNVAFEGAAEKSRVHQRRIEVVQAVGHHVQKVSADSSTIAFDDDRDRRNPHKDVEVRARVRGASVYTHDDAVDQYVFEDLIICVTDAIAEARDT